MLNLRLPPGSITVHPSSSSYPEKGPSTGPNIVSEAQFIPSTTNVVRTKREKLQLNISDLQRQENDLRIFQVVASDNNLINDNEDKDVMDDSEVWAYDDHEVVHNGNTVSKAIRKSKQSKQDVKHKLAQKQLFQTQRDARMSLLKARRTNKVADDADELYGQLSSDTIGKYLQPNKKEKQRQRSKGRRERKIEIRKNRKMKV